ncbi:MotA/TolQ/ExbB proton channel family protein [Limibacterium fermenti]|uniref:MotA/TolQ/ExbB proton channel family protein n=1 Tax=Limibacterium fermenti TaxID=3229863 RepID=UPI000E995C21|nr:biopolymer transporter ExbB [Porphyromonadaceae bacterium]
MNILQIVPPASDSLQQIQQQVQQEVTNVLTSSEPSQTIIDLAFNNGWFMIVLLLLFLSVIYIFIERALVIQRAAKEEDSFMNRIKDYILEEKTEAAVALCRKNNTPASAILQKGIDLLGRPVPEIADVMKTQQDVEIIRLNKGMPLLAALSLVAPLLGLLITTVGVTQHLMTVAYAGSSASIASLASAFYLPATSVIGGLIVGIVGLCGYFHLKNSLRTATGKLTEKRVEFIEFLSHPAE